MSGELETSLAENEVGLADLATEIRQMIAVLEDERQSLAALDLDGMMAARNSKYELCEMLQLAPANRITDECRELLQTARQLNEVNRRVRNLLAANVSARIDALSGDVTTYSQSRVANF